MTRNFKALGLALLAVLALSAVVSSAAQAKGAEVTTTTYPANLTGKDVNTAHGKLTRLTIGNGARFVECTTANLTGTLPEAGAGEKEKATRETVTTHAEFSGCFANGLTAVPATVTMNGCDFTITGLKTTEAAGSVMCPGSAEIQVHIYENETQHGKNVSLCTYDIGNTNNQNLGKIGISAGTTDGVADLTLALNIVKIKTLSTIGSAGLCGIASGVTGESSLAGTNTVTGETSGGTAQGIMMQ